jgi:hypothetical protein
MATTPGTATPITGTGDRELFVALTSDATSGLSNAALGDCGLALSVSAGNPAPVFMFELFATFTSNATADIRFGLTAPSGWTASWGASKDLGVAAATTGPTALAIGDPLVVGGAATTVLSQVLAKGTLVGSTTTSGTFAVQMAQGTSDGTDAAVMKSGKCYLRLVKLN